MGREAVSKGQRSAGTVLACLLLLGSAMASLLTGPAWATYPEPDPDAPVADFTFTTTDELDPVAFHDASVDPVTGEPDPANWTYDWDFGGLGSSDAQDPTFDFHDGGDFPVRLTVTDAQGRAGTVEKWVAVPQVPPVPAFDATVGEEGEPVAFASTTTHPSPADQDPAGWTYLWDFAGLGNSTAAAPEFTFPDGGRYKVRLTVTDDDGQSAWVERGIVIPGVAPLADFEARATDELAEVAFLDLTTHPNPTDADPSAWTFAWDFDGHGTSTERNPRFRFPDGGRYHVTLEVTDNDGGVGTVTRPVDVAHVAPAADFLAAAVGEVTPVAFTDATTHPNPADRDPAGWTFAWSFDGLGSSTKRNPTHRFAEGGAYDITLTVVDDDGASATITKQVVVPHTPPDAALRFTVRENGLLRLFDVSTHRNPADMNNSAWTFRWDFGDGASAAGREVAHRYATVGVVEVTLRVTDNDNATGVLRRTIDLTDTSPVPDFVIDGPAMSEGPLPPYTTLPTKFVDRTTDDRGIVSWKWDFGDGSPPVSLQNPQHVYALGGDYVVTLEVVDTAGSFEVLKRTVHICSNPAEFRMAPYPHLAVCTVVHP